MSSQHQFRQPLELEPLFTRSTESTTGKLNRQHRRAIRFHRAAHVVSMVAIVGSFFLGRATSATPTAKAKAIATPISKEPLVCVVPTGDDANVTPNQMGTPRCVNHCELTMAGDPDHMITYWTYASVAGFRQYIGQPCPVMPPYPPSYTPAGK